MGKLMALSPEQQSQLSPHRDRWLSIGLSTEPGNRPRAEDAVARLYEAASLAPPATILWLPSPLHGALAEIFLKVGAQVWDLVRDLVRDQVWDQVWDQVGDQVRDQEGDLVWDQVWDQVGDQVGDLVRDLVRDQVWDQVGDQVWGQVRDQVGDQVGDQVLYGLHDAPWLAWATYFRDICGIALTAQLQPLVDLAAEAGWCWAFNRLCIITEKPSRLRRDDGGRLHCETGPAIDYGCGSWGLWAWHGVCVPAAVIEQPESLTAGHVLSEPNTEVRRAMIERIGWGEFARRADARVIDQDVEVYRAASPPTPAHAEWWSDGLLRLPRRLIAIDIPDLESGPAVFVHLIDPSQAGHEYIHPVPPDVRTCKQALQAMYPDIKYRAASRDGLEFVRIERRKN